MNAHQQPPDPSTPPIGDPSRPPGERPGDAPDKQAPGQQPTPRPGQDDPDPGRDNRTSRAGQANPAGRESPTIRP